MWAGAFDGLVTLFRFMAIMLIIFVPLGAWKAWELLSALFKHITWVN